MKRRLGRRALWTLALEALAVCGACWPGMARSEAPERLVLAFYYAWYANPEVSGRWRHWEGVDAAARNIESATHYPSSGAYDSSDPAVIQRHMRQLAAAGIDGLIVSWWGPGSPDSDLVMPRILAEAEASGRLVSAYLENCSQPNTEASVGRQLIFLVDTYAKHPSWLRRNGRPVIFVYGRVVDEVGPLETWNRLRQRVIAATGVDPFLVGDRLSLEAAQVFDGLHTYNPAEELAGSTRDTLARNYRLHAELGTRLARAANRLACVTVIPGYDDTRIRKPGIRIDRFDGATYRAAWDAAQAADADWALITTWNEWHEGSELEESIELGSEALDATARYTERFHTARAPAQAEPASAAWAEFQQRWKSGPVGVVAPRFGGVTAALADANLPVRFLTFDDLRANRVSSRECPIIVFAGGESAALSGGELPSFAEAVQRYLDAGGTWVWASWEPWPLLRDTASNQTNWLGQELGVHLEAGFEKPPAAAGQVRVQFLGALEPLGTVEYPTTGDLRFRPIRPERNPAEKFETLAELLDEQGRSLGVAVAQLTRGPGRMIYVANRVPATVEHARFWQAILDLARPR